MGMLWLDGDRPADVVDVDSDSRDGIASFRNPGSGYSVWQISVQGDVLEAVLYRCYFGDVQMSDQAISEPAHPSSIVYRHAEASVPESEASTRLKSEILTKATVRLMS